MNPYLSYVEKLSNAENTRCPIPSFADIFKGDIEEAYKIQCEYAEKRMARGEELVGYKVGITSLEAQRHFNLSHPDFGHLFQSMQVISGSKFKGGELIQPKIEAEIAFLMKEDLKGPGVTFERAFESIGCATVALEIIDSRFENWKIGAFDTIADNGSSARFVLGEKHVPVKGLDLPHLGMALSMDGEVQITASGAAVMGHPVNAVVFLANELSKVGKGLRAGQWILSGSLGGMLPLKDNSSYDAEILHLGKVSVR